MAVVIKYTGEGIKALQAKLEQLKQKAVYVGIPAEQNPNVEGAKNFNMAALAAVLEFGNERIPSRPFLRQTLSENAEKYTALFADWFKEGGTVEVIYNRLASIAQGDVQDNMVKGNWVANADSTKIAWRLKDLKGSERRKARKGLDPNSINKKPLIWEGKLKGSIMGVVK